MWVVYKKKMNRKIIIEKNALTVQMAILKDDEFIQFHMSPLFEAELQNKIVIGQVMQVVKNLKAIFIDYGDEKNGMLHLKQIPEQLLSKAQIGARLPVQIVKQNIGDKGHKLTSKLNLAGRYLICLPFESGINISRQITDKEYRKALKEHIEAIDNPNNYGFIIRTNAENVSMEALIEDAKQLIEKTNALMAEKDYLAKGNVLYEEPSMIFKILLDKLSDGNVYEVVCNDQNYLDEIRDMMASYSLEVEHKWTYYQESLSIWSSFSLSKKIDELIKRKVWLKSGGNLMIDYTEAMTVVDVNSAKAILTKNPDKAVLKLNMEAVQEAILQILRRNLSGMILIDLVEMKNPGHKKEIYEYALHLLERYEDHRTKVYPLTELGLLQFSRTK